MSIQWIKVSRRELNTILGKNGHEPYSCGAFHTSTDGISHKIYLLHHASTNFRLHELGHVVSGHIDVKGITFGEIAKRELEAEAFRYSKIGKPYDAFLFLIPIWLLTTIGCRPCHTFKWIKEHTDGYITMTSQNRSAIWTYVIEYYHISRKGKKEGTSLW